MRGAIVSFLLVAALSVSAAETRLGVDGSRFTVNGKPTFLLGISYYSGLGASEQTLKADLGDAQRYGFNWIRVWATCQLEGANVSAVEAEGKPREPYLRRLQQIVDECDRRGMLVDVTLTRGRRAAGNISSLEGHLAAVETLVTRLKTRANWYLDIGNERDVRDDRHVSVAEVRRIRDHVKKLDPSRLVTASFGGHDLGEQDIRDALVTGGVDFLAIHRPRHAGSADETEAQTRRCLKIEEKLGLKAPVHHQEPFRRGYEKWDPVADDFLRDLRGAAVGGAAGWCFHNGSQRTTPDHQPRRSFDLSEKRLFDQLDDEERKFLAALANTRAALCQ
jgi:hypothetical protein